MIQLVYILFSYLSITFLKISRELSIKRRTSKLLSETLRFFLNKLYEYIEVPCFCNINDSYNRLFAVLPMVVMMK